MDAKQLVRRIVDETDPQARVQLIYSAKGQIAPNDWPAVCAAVAAESYVPQLAPTFHFVPFPCKYADEAGFAEAYRVAAEVTEGFSVTNGDRLAAAIKRYPPTLRIFRLVAGYTPQELATSVELLTMAKLSGPTIERLEGGGAASARITAGVEAIAALLSAIVSGDGGFAVSGALAASDFRTKVDKPDTRDGWRTVAEWHADGLPYWQLLYQRFYGGAFRQVQDAGGYLKGNLLEDAVETLFDAAGVPALRTTNESAQREARETFGVTVQPAPDFIPHDASGVAKALLECKSANDGGTARDKAARFKNLRTEGERLSIPVIAILEGFGWRRTSDALGPVIGACDGRVFSLSNLDDLLRVEPIASLAGSAAAGQGAA